MQAIYTPAILCRPPASSYHAARPMLGRSEVCNKDYRKYCEYVLEMKSASDYA